MLLGDKSAVKGGSGKVINSTAGDRIFVYYSDHGGPGVLGELAVLTECSIFQTEQYDVVSRTSLLNVCYYHSSGMPNLPFLYAGDFIEVLKKKHTVGSYKEMVTRAYT